MGAMILSLLVAALALLQPQSTFHASSDLGFRLLHSKRDSNPSNHAVLQGGQFGSITYFSLGGFLGWAPVLSKAAELEGFDDEAEGDDLDDADSSVPEGVPPVKVVQQKQPGDIRELLDEDEDGDVSLGSENGKGKSEGALEGFENEVGEEQENLDAVKPIPSTKAPPRTWDEDEFEGLPVEGAQEAVPKPEAAKKEEKKVKRAKVAAKKGPLRPKDLIMEAIFVLFLTLYGMNYLRGLWTNEHIALTWAEQFASEGSIFEKNFSLLGTGDGKEEEPLLIKEGPNTFKFYASGRRFCEFMLVTLELKQRHDLLSLLWYLVIPAHDNILVEVAMKPEAMDQFLFAVTKKKAAKGYLKEQKDLKEYASVMDFSSRSEFPADDLAVLGDSREAANELLSEAAVEHLFGPKAWPSLRDNFILLHFTDNNPYGPHKKMLRFSFVVPHFKQMADISRFMTAIPYFIDAVGKFSLSPTAKAKAEAAREKAKFEEERRKRADALQMKREDRRKAEEARLTPEELAKRIEKERLKSLKKAAPKMRVTR